MGTTLTPIAVEIEKVRAACGSRDQGFLDSIVGKYVEDFEQFDEMGESLAEEWAEEGYDGSPLSMREVLRQMIMGEEYDPRAGFLYGFGLKFICLRLGKVLSNERWCSLRLGALWFLEIDRKLLASEVPEDSFRINGLLKGRGSPVALPEIEDYPVVGFMALGEMETARQALGRCEVSILGDESIVKALAEVQEWLGECLETRRDLVCFYA